jgi:HEAT repeat protein
MILRTAVLCWLAACSPATQTAPEPPTMTDPDLDLHLATLSNRVPQADFERSMAWFSDHPDIAIPALIQAIEADDARSARAATALANAGPQAVPSLAAALSSSTHVTRRAAATALATSGEATAFDALLAGVGAEQSDTINAALHGLALAPPHSRACATLATARSHSDEVVRAYAEQAAVHHGCEG